MAMSDRWIPYKQTNGISIYHHNQSDESTGIGGEFMASSVRRPRVEWGGGGVGGAAVVPTV